METCADRRLRKLKWLIEKTEGGLDEVSGPGFSSEYLQQILDGRKLPPRADKSRVPRSLGDEAARGIEEKFRLGRGWFDNDWPFDTVDQDAYESLSERQKGIVEEAMREAIARCKDASMQRPVSRKRPPT